MVINKVESVIRQQVRDLEKTFLDARKIDWVRKHLRGNVQALAIGCESGLCTSQSRPELRGLPQFAQSDLIELLRLIDIDESKLTSRDSVLLSSSTNISNGHSVFSIVVKAYLMNGDELVNFMCNEPIPSTVNVMIQRKKIKKDVFEKAYEGTSALKNAVEAVNTVADLVK
ncbi:hypothetical protein KW428_21620 [Vibrio fluvialis]|uniref:hypothetical protein n=1 Tax=Vibrio fluvialis TaxID=676 RepID=UPI001C9CF28F|nr:hypothetical protein [Vibrio fluvialis]ELS3717369.1 hypothetical protein [Vibrio fluvialis]ELX9694069.1 hypothetical protein [Vibrio fluvialis]MBY7865265.1 hypothetical protein [Vibrio fluvialis]WMN57869.1 hypothetical protein NI390_16395 [Vibrio fluvialis]